MEKFPIFEIETTENKIVIYGAVGHITFYDYTEDEAKKQYIDHYNQVTRVEKLGEAFKNAGETTKKASNNLNKFTESLKAFCSMVEGWYGL